ncbi:lamin tail domain-containing protein [Archangium sp.]|uniref:lamin tail domain-containing protein n=1 Tax=Archangium sp. TaxID=1872627 RepID=UPI00389B2FE2
MLTRPWSVLRSLLLLTVLLPALAGAQGLRFTTLDIGQGDSGVLIAPGGCVALFDGGPTGSGTTIKAYLKSLGVTRIDMVFISHLHTDHMGGIDEVDVGTNAVPITQVYDHGGTYSSTAYTEYSSHFAGKRTTVRKGDTFSLCGQVTLSVVAANGNGVSTTDENTKSVVVKISYGAFDGLVGGDLTGTPDDVESLIATQVGPLELYKVHHHGSRYSSTNPLLDATNPTVSFISVGRDNTYGHPTVECLDRLTAHNSDIWQTEDPAMNKALGHIELTSSADGSTFTVKQGTQSVSYASKGGGTDTTAPTAPSGLSASAASASQVNLSWTASTDNVGVASYNIYRSTDNANFVAVASTTGTTYSDTGRAASTTYYYRVTADDVAGNESAVSNTASATTPAASSPAKVIINEILANEPGSATDGEFVELVNVGGTSIDISGWTVSDATSVRHTFPTGTVLGVGKAIAVFGGSTGIPAGTPNAVVASTGTLSLNNTGDTVTVKNGATTINAYTYASSLAAQDGVSMNRSPDASATGGFVLHTTLSSLSASPGERVNGNAF